MNENNKVIHENFVVVRQFEKFTCINDTCGQSQPRVLESRGWSHPAIMVINVSKVTHNNQIFRNDFVFSHL